MINKLKSEFENFYNASSNFMFVDGYSGIGKSLFAKQICEDINRINGDISAVLTNVSSRGSGKEFITSLIRRMDENLLRNSTLFELKSHLLTLLSQHKLLVIDGSQNLLISNRSLVNHFILLSWIVEQTNIKVLYLGAIPLQLYLESLYIVDINRRSVHYSLIA